MSNDATADRIAELEAQVADLKAQNQKLQTAEPQRQPKSWRSVLGGILLTLGLVALVPAGLLLWLDRTVLDQEQYLKSVGPVIEQPAVQAAIEKSATDAIFSNVNVEQIVGDALPAQAAFLAAPITTQVKTYTGTTIDNIVKSDQFANVWVSVNTKAHEAFMRIANGRGDATIDVNELYSFITGQLKGTQLASLADKQLPARVGNIEIANIPALEQIPQYVNTLQTWRWAILGIMAVLLAAAVAVARNRRRMLIWLGIGAILAALVTLVVVRLTRAMTLDPIGDPVYRDAAVAAWRTVLDPLLVQVAVLTVIGLAIVTTGWLAGPGRVATTIRTTVQGWLARGRAAVMPTAESWGWIKSARRHHGLILWGLLILTVLGLLALTPLSVPTILGILGLAVLVLILIEFVLAQPTWASMNPASPSASRLGPHPDSHSR